MLHIDTDCDKDADLCDSVFFMCRYDYCVDGCVFIARVVIRISKLLDVLYLIVI